MLSTLTLQTDALTELENVLKIARDDLDAAIAVIIDGLEPWGLFDEAEDGKRRVDTQALAELLDNVGQADGAVASLFDEYDWRVARAFRELRLKRAQP